MHHHTLLLAFALLACHTSAATHGRVDRRQRQDLHKKTSGWTISNGTNLHFPSEQDESDAPQSHEQGLWKRTMGPAWTGQPKLRQNQVSTGVSAMQLTVVGQTHILVIDKSENNPLQITGNTPVDNGKTHPAWIQWLDYTNGQGHAMQAQTNTFCAGGVWLSNGSFVSIGGNPAVNKASYYDQNGITGIRVFDQCDDSQCTIYENPGVLRLSSARWYPGTVRLADGSAFIAGGMTQGGFNNYAADGTDNPTFEFFPSKSLNNGMPIYSKFLHEALNSNLFPVMHLLPGGNIFVAANTRAMIYNWQKNKEQILPDLPNGVRITYPFSAASALLPLTIANKWQPTAWFCGGSTINDNLPARELSAETPASKQCASMLLTKSGIKKGWQVERMQTPRIMGDAIITPDGKIVVVNGAKTGVAGYGNVHNVIGQSNADNPDYQGFIYDPLKKFGKRISYNMPTSKIARMYHSSATLTPSGDVLISGSNPNADVSTAVYQTEYRVELLSPPYQSSPKPTFTWCPANILYKRSFKIILESFPSNTKLSDISVVLMDLGYHTHAVGVDQRMIELNIKSWDQSNNQVLIKSPMDGTYMPAGRAWLFVVIKGIPSEGCAVIVGDGSDPPFDAAAHNNMMSKTAHLHGDAVL